MFLLASALLSVALILQPSINNASSTPIWQSLPMEQALPELTTQGYVDHDAARIWYGVVGNGEPVVLLHGGMESSLSWGNQVPALTKTREEQLVRSEKLGAAGRLAATIAHEVNNPLASVMNLLYLARRAHCSEETMQYVRSAETELKRASSITKRTLGFTETKPDLKS